MAPPGLYFFKRREMSLSDAQMVADLLQAVVTSAAIFIGAVWAYYKFVKGRTFKSSLETDIVGEATRDGGFVNVIAAIAVKNVGASKVDIQRRHTALRVLEGKVGASTDIFEAIDWEHLGTSFVLKSRSRLEPGETAVDTHLFRAADTGQIAFKLEMYVASERTTFGSASSLSISPPKAIMKRDRGEDHNDHL